MENFYISCPMGLESIAWEEISHKWELYLATSTPTAKIVLGGIAIDCDLESGLAINLFSKTANRVLLRVKEQKCRDIPKLFNIFSKINWKKFLKRDDVNFSISCHESRLFNTKKIQKACEDGLKKYFNANQLSQKIKDKKDSFHKQTIFLRFDNDLLTISIDTSGDLLHIRGNQKFRGLASIRSTLASCLLRKVLKDQISYSLIDPMCGSATFLKEARDFYELSERRFPFHDWDIDIKINKILKDLPYNALYGFDIDSNIIDKVKKESPSILFETKDIFKDQYEIIKDSIIIINPPYGKRVKLSLPREDYFQSLVDTLIKKFKPKKLGIILPLDIKLKQKSSKTKIFNSGIWLYFHEVKC